MLEYLPLILNFAVVLLSLVWVQYNLDKLGIGMGNKLFWLWSVAVLVGWLFFQILGVVVVLIAYYFWIKRRNK